MSFDINTAKGVFNSVEAAIEATHKAQVEFYANSTKESREAIIAAIRGAVLTHAEDFAKRLIPPKVPVQSKASVRSKSSCVCACASCACACACVSCACACAGGGAR